MSGAEEPRRQRKERGVRFPSLQLCTPQVSTLIRRKDAARESPCDGTRRVVATGGRRRSLLPVIFIPYAPLVDGLPPQATLYPSRCAWSGSAGRGWRVPRGEAGGDGQIGQRVVAVRSGCIIRIKLSGRAKEKRLVWLVEAATERAVATLLKRNPCKGTFGG
jgi:hypothetical protein